jgi:hypothetical protein
MVKHGVALVLAGFALCGTTLESVALERWLDVHNQSNYTVCELYISHVDTRNWGRDQFGSHCLDPGEVIHVDPGYQQGYCKMDMQFVYEDGDSFTVEDYNICEETDFYIH